MNGEEYEYKFKKAYCKKCKITNMMNFY